LVVTAALERARSALARADRILLTAGAGLTASAGINYADPDLFRRHFPAMLQYGFTAQYQFIGFDRWDPELQWGYWAAHVDLVRFRWPTTAVYGHVRSLLEGRESFVLTSNVDAMFERNGVPKQRVHTPQGDYAFLQCTRPCTREVWRWKQRIDLIRAATDPHTQRLQDSGLVPSCPRCGGTVFPNVRIDASFVDDHFAETGAALERWLAEGRTDRGVVLELGAGFNTPGVVRFPGERLVRALPDWTLVRVNLTDADVPAELGGRGVSLPGDAAGVLQALSGAGSA